MTDTDTHTHTDHPAASRITDNIVFVGDQPMMKDGKGRLTPLALVKPEEQLEDQMVRKIIGYADALSEQIARFRGHTFDDVGAFLSLLAEKYNAKRGGQKGNTTFTSYDGCLKVQIQVADTISFGPGLQIAKELVDECIAEWSADSRDEIKALVNDAFAVDKEGLVNRAAIFGLRRIQIADERWQRAMEAITDSIRVVGSKSYVRFYRRPDANGRWEAITIDLAAA